MSGLSIPRPKALVATRALNSSAMKRSWASARSTGREPAVVAATSSPADFRKAVNSSTALVVAE